MVAGREVEFAFVSSPLSVVSLGLVRCPLSLVRCREGGGAEDCLSEGCHSGVVRLRRTVPGSASPIRCAGSRAVPDDYAENCPCFTKLTRSAVSQLFNMDCAGGFCGGISGFSLGVGRRKLCDALQALQCARQA